jgi:hypothetical protein
MKPRRVVNGLLVPALSVSRMPARSAILHQ